ncbi:mucin-5AC-like [Anopheles bellator]|uniref:mucin-5AC-like n=1 Tax=Anopheles bellator TaxID=139047 RepID=UPI00264809C9|nr:mucin-5AC-like [Anopheles bellator]
MGLGSNLNLIIRIWLTVITFHRGHSENAEPRALELSYGHTPAAPKYMTTQLLQTIYSPSSSKPLPPSKPFVKSDQITTLNMVHSSTPKITAAISSHGAVGVKSAKFNGQFRDSAPLIVQKSTLKPHPVINKLQSHMAIAGFRPKQPIATSSNRLEQFINPNLLYGTYIQFGQSPAILSQPSKTKFLGQLNSGVPSFDTQTLKSFFNAPAYTPSVAQFKKLNYIQQQQQQQQQQQPLGSVGKFSFPHFNQIPADLAEFPKKYVTPSSAEKELTKGAGGIDSTPLFPHLPPSVLTPFFQQVQQQQQQSSSYISGNKYNNFNLKTQHPAPPVAPQSGSASKHSFSQQSQLFQQAHQTDQESLAEFDSGSPFGGAAFGSYSTAQPLPIDHKPFEIVKFKEAPGKQLPNKYNEIRDEYSKNLVPPPPSTQQAPFLPTVLNHLAESSPSKDPIEILSKYNIHNPHSPLQDANRFSYEFPRPTSGAPALSTATSTTTTTQFPTATTLPRQQYYPQQHHYNSPQHTFHNGEHHFQQHQSPVLVTPFNELGDGSWFNREKYLTTEKPNVFKHLFRPAESEYKQHKLMHPSYTGLPPNRRPSSAPSTTTTTPASVSATTSSPWDQSTEEPVITHSFFTIEDAIADPTLVPPKSKNKYKYTTDAEEENRQEDLQLEIVTIGPYFGAEESPLLPMVTTVAPSRGSQGAKGSANRRRRPKPPHHSSTTTEYSTEPESAETTTNAGTTLDARNRNRIRFRPKPVTTVPPAEAEAAPTTTQPTPPPLATFASNEEFDGTVIKKFRKKPHFTRNRFTVLNQREEDKASGLPGGTEPPVGTLPPATTTTSSTTVTSTFIAPSEAGLPAVGGGLRSRYRPAPQSKAKDSQEETLGEAGAKVSTRQQNRLPVSSSTVASSTDAGAIAAVFNSDESTLNFSEAQNKSSAPGRGGELNRPRFSIKEYRNKLNRTATATPTPTAGSEVETTTATKLRFPTRNRFLLNARLNKTLETNEIAPTGVGATTERTGNETTTRSSFRPHGTRTYNRFTVKKPVTETSSVSSANRSQPAGVGTLANRGRTKSDLGTNRTTVLSSSSGSTFNTTASLINRRPPKITLRQRIQNFNRKKESDQPTSGAGAVDDGTQKRDEPVVPASDQDNLLSSSAEQTRPIDDLGTLGESGSPHRFGGQEESSTRGNSVPSTTEGYRHHETAIMKISPKDPNTAVTSTDDYDLNSASSDYSKRVVELTLSGTGHKDRGSFKSVNKGLLSRKVPGYFTLATEDPILPIEAFFPQVKKPSGGFA